MNANELKTTLNGLAYYWPFDNNGNEIINGRNAFINNGDLTARDRFGNINSALSLNGINAYAQAPSGIYFNGPFTITAWIKINKFTANAKLIDFGNGQANNNIVISVSAGFTGESLIYSKRQKFCRVVLSSINSYYTKCYIPLDR